MATGKETFWNTLIENCKSFENSLASDFRKRTGSYFTSFPMAQVMVCDLIDAFRKKYGKELLAQKIFLEPCGGTGNFIYCYLNEISKLGFSDAETAQIINNIYYCDANKKAADFYKSTFAEFCKTYFNIVLDEEYFSSHIGNALLFDVCDESSEYISLHDVFPQFEKADIIITNPPYKNFKAETKHYENKTDYERDSAIYAKIKQSASEIFQYSIDGILNFYKLFVEEIMDRYAGKDAFVNLLIPSSILSDKNCSDLRKHILRESKVISIKVIPEGVDVVDARQGLCAMLMDKAVKTGAIQMYRDFYHFPKEVRTLRLSDIKSLSSDWNILPLSKDEIEKLKTLHDFPKVKELPYIKNLRGELDLTLNGASIVKGKTAYKLIRGRDIGYYKINNVETKEFALPEFATSTAKSDFIKNERIVCQQIVNKNKARRVSFAPVKKGYVLANSCNFIALDKNAPLSLNFLMGVFNSSIINWYFKLSSSNNHINNYEIDEFPVPVNSPYKNKIESLVLEYLKTENADALDEIDALVNKSFFNSEKTPRINLKLEEAIKKGRERKEYLLSGGKVLNHTTFKLSELDIETIKNVPQGGNWKNIPTAVIKKSKRLERIAKNGGRTTLYGRIDYSKPAYTITTYFNRPGNGTYAHPHFNRVLSVREAARIQSFPDDYYFYGNKTQLLNQVGNAVPPLLAYQIASKIISVTKCVRTIDLFCGAGGMTCGFKLAGMKSLLATDIEESACATLAINNPDIPILCGDITNERTKAEIINTAKNGGAEIICGGPPCQGFSMAGFRSSDDPRNQLFRDFIDIVKAVQPKIVVFENVEGLLSYENGNTYKEILQLFSDIGYNCLGRLLNTSDYGVPQRRKRVIIICVRKDKEFEPAQLFPEPLTIEEPAKTTAFDAIGDLENIPCGDDVVYSAERQSDFVKTLEGKVAYSAFIKRIKKVAAKQDNQPSLFDF